MKKVLSILLAVLLAISVSPAGVLNMTASAETANVEEIYTYKIIQDQVIITGLDSDFSGNLEIPSTLGGCPVVGIQYGAFHSKSRLTSVSIPNSVTFVGTVPFYGCNNLTDITVAADNPYYVSEDGVLFNKDKTELICYPAKKSGTYAVPDSVQSIGASAFERCTGLTELTLPNSVQSIGASAFEWCTGLTELIIPDSVTYLGVSAFLCCTGLNSVTIGNSVTAILDITFSNCTALTTVTIPDSVTDIGASAFFNCKALTSVALGNGVIRIGNFAFQDCTNLTSVTWGNSVTSIGGFAFDGCQKLTAMTVPDSVTTIENGAFFNTAYYNDPANWENGVLYIGKHLIKANSSEMSSSEYAIKEGTSIIAYYAFSDCERLASISIPNSVTHIGDSAFAGCTGLTSISIPNSVISIGNFAFLGCASIADITVAADNMAYVSEREGLFNKNKSELIVCLMKKSDLYVVPDGVTDIHGSAFSGCIELTSVVIPDSVVTVWASAFADCIGLTNVWYQGSESHKAKMLIGSKNECLNFAAWHYNTSIDAITSSEYKVGTDQISKVTEGTTVEQLLAGINEGAICGVYQEDSLLNKDVVVGTGMKVQISYEDKVTASCSIVVAGDIDGDSGIAARDALLALQHTVGLVDLQKAYAAAADVDGNNQIDAMDALLILQYLVKLIEFFPVNQPSA